MSTRPCVSRVSARAWLGALAIAAGISASCSAPGPLVAPRAGRSTPTSAPAPTAEGSSVTSLHPAQIIGSPASQPSATAPSRTPASTSPAVGHSTSTTKPSRTGSKPPLCTRAQFEASLNTSSEVYGLGQSVPIKLEIKNLGASCTSESGHHNPDVLEGCPDVKAVNAFRKLVWDDDANPQTGIACAGVGIVGTVAAGWTTSDSYSWNEDLCPASGARCTQKQVPSGTYTIEFAGAEDAQAWLGIRVKPAVVKID